MGKAGRTLLKRALGVGRTVPPQACDGTVNRLLPGLAASLTWPLGQIRGRSALLYGGGFRVAQHLAGRLSCFPTCRHSMFLAMRNLLERRGARPRPLSAMRVRDRPACFPRTPGYAKPSGRIASPTAFRRSEGSAATAGIHTGRRAGGDRACDQRSLPPPCSQRNTVWDCAATRGVLDSSLRCEVSAVPIVGCVPSPLWLVGFQRLTVRVIIWVYQTLLVPSSLPTTAARLHATLLVILRHHHLRGLNGHAAFAGSLIRAGE